MSRIAPTSVVTKTSILLGALLVGNFGCDRASDEALVIATSWPEAQRDELEAGFRGWIEAHPDTGHRPPRIVWIAPTEGHDPTVLVERRVAVDLVLGGPAAAYDRLEAEGRLEGRVVRRSPLGLAAREETAPPGQSSWAVLGETARRGRVALDDPRGAPIVREWATARLNSGSWAQGYAELVRAAGNARPIGRSGGSALARLERGEDVLVPVSLHQVAKGSGIAFVRPDEAPEWAEGVGLMRGARNPDQARAFLDFLGERAGTAAPSSAGHPGTDALLAVLLGATLVDAQDELRDAWTALVRAGRPAAWEERMTAAPPWPPASVAEMRAAPEGTSWVDTLAEQVAPHVAGRGWLEVSWERSQRPIDGRLLDELAGVDGGRLARDPRFRAWLRGEWTAWARQRYRWIAREVEKGAP